MALIQSPRILRMYPTFDDGHTWGHWTYDAEILTLHYRDEAGFQYEIDLEKCNTSGQILDWICQVSQKMWCTPQDAGHLVQALTDLLRPQAHVCSFGVEKRLSARNWLQRDRQRIPDSKEIL